MVNVWFSKHIFRTVSEIGSICLCKMMVCTDGLFGVFILTFLVLLLRWSSSSVVLADASKCSSVGAPLPDSSEKPSSWFSSILSSSKY